MSEALRRVMLASEGAGELSGSDVRRGRAEHPVCGDLVQIDLRVKAGAIEELAWRARGCPACMAVVAAAPEALRGVPLDDVEPALQRRLAALGGLATHERHAVGLLLRAVAAATGPAAGR